MDIDNIGVVVDCLSQQCDNGQSPGLALLLTIQVEVRQTAKSRASAAARLRVVQVVASLPQFDVVLQQRDCSIECHG